MHGTWPQVAGLGFRGVRTRYASKLRLHHVSRARLEPAATRFSTGTKRSKRTKRTIDGARVRVAIARLGKIRARVAAVCGRCVHTAAAALRPRATAVGARGPFGKLGHDTVHGAWPRVAALGFLQVWTKLAA